MDHPIEGLMDSVMGSIKSMVDVDTIVGEAVHMPDGTIIIPISTVSFGFGAGGSQFESKKNTPTQNSPMFGGGCGGGANIKPVAFLVVGNGNIRIMPITDKMTTIDRVIDLVPDMVNRINNVVADISTRRTAKKEKKKEEKDPVVEPFMG